MADANLSKGVLQQYNNVYQKQIACYMLSKGHTVLRESMAVLKDDGMAEDLSFVTARTAVFKVCA